MAQNLNFSKCLTGIFCIGALLGCGDGFEMRVSDGQISFAAEEPPPEPTPTPAPEPFAFQPLLWEPVRKDGKAWSDYAFSLLRGEAQAILKATDFATFCPNYNSLSLDEKINAAGLFVSAMVKFESSFNPVRRYQESTMGTDPVTGLPVWSEGLLQLSYQDTIGYPFCPFDWETDQYLSPTNPAKSILDPYKNLYCGMRILAHQVNRRGTLVVGSGAYWAVIKQGSAYEKIDEIAALVSSLEFCRQ